MTDQKRTLSIEARVRDFMTRNFGTMGRAVHAFAAFTVNSFRRILGAIRPMHLAFAGFSSLWLGFKGGKTLEEILDAVSTFDKLGDALGTDVDRMIALQAALELSGVSAEKFTSSMSALGRALAQGFERNDQNIVGSMHRLGLTLEQVKKLDAVSLLDRIAKGLEGIGSDAERSAVLAQLFGRGFQVMFVPLAKGQDEFRKLVATAQYFVGTIGEDGAKAAVRLGDALFLVKKTMEAVGRVALVELAKQFAPTVERIASYFANNRDRLARGLAALIETLLRAAIAIGAAFAKLAAYLATNFDDVIAKLQDIPLIGDAIGKALSAAFDIPQLDAKAKELRTAALGIASSIVEAQNQLAAIAANPEEMDSTGQRTQALTEKIRALRNELFDLSTEFAKQTNGGIALDAGKLAQDAMRSANLRNLGSVVQQLGNLNDLPGLPPDMPLLVRALFGDLESDDNVETKTSSFMEGITDELSTVRKKWTDFGQAGKEAVSTLLDGGLDGLVDAFASIVTGTKSAKEAFRDYAKQLLTDLARIIGKLVIMKALEQFGLSATAKADGGVVHGTMQGTQRLRKFASGGVAHGPTLAVFGEGRESEAFVPLKDNRSIPVSFVGGGAGGGGSVVQISIHAMDSRDVQRLLMDQQGTFLTMLTNALETRHGLRHTVRRAVA